MALFNCLPTLVGRKKKGKFGFQGDVEFSPEHVRGSNGIRTLQVKLKTSVETSELVESSSTPSNVPKISCCEVEVVKNKIHEEKEVPEVAYEGEDEREDKSSTKRDISDCDLPASVNSGKEVHQLGSEGSPDNSSQGFNEGSMNKSDKEASEESELIKSGHASDPGMTIEHWASPKLQRCCSSLDTREVLRKIVDQLPPSKNQSFEELQELANKTTEDAFLGSPCSHSSALTRRSADKVILKKHSYSQILPSRSKRLWWKLFLWSHRNSQQQQLVGAKTQVSRFASLNQQGGYSSDTLEPSRVKKLSKEEPSSPFSEIHSYDDGSGKAQKWEGFKDGVSGLWPQNQWVAFPGESSPLKRVDDWVKDLDIQSVTSSVEGETDNNNIVFPPSPEANISVAKGSVYLSRHNKVNLSAELVHGNNVIRSLNASSTVAHISGMGLKIVPIMSQFSSLRSVNLSNNAIVQITHGSLPKGLHVLDLSRNKINTIEGLRELTRLRVLNLSFNRISRVGHGLSNCTLLKELYLCGNKISEVEGLHRLLKLTLLDLSFNKITTTKALGQLVANYNSLLALNLLGNPIQGNLSEDQLRKAICGLLPKLAYLNKQPVNQQKAREVPMDIIAKALARSSSNWNTRRKLAKKVVSQGGYTLSGSTTKGHATVARKSRNRVKNRTTDYSGSRMRA